MRTLFTLLLCTSLSLSLPAQGLIEKVADLMEFNLGKAKTDTTEFQPKIVMAPIVFFEPNTSFGFGFGASLLFKPKGAGAETRTSNIPIGISYTLKNQVFFSASPTIFFPEEKWLLRGNIGYSDFPQTYFGVGNGTRDEDGIEITYQRLLIEPLLLRQAIPHLFVGGGFRYNTYYNNELIEDTELLEAGASLQDTLGSKSVGLEFAASYDDRDNVVNATRGILAEFTQGFYGEVLGGSNTFRLSKLDLRTYHRVNPKGVVGGQFYLRHSTPGAPIQELSSLGGPDLLRGFQEFRFRDNLAAYAQLEYRWQTWKSIGFVFFGGAGEVASSSSKLAFDELRYNVGTGIRAAVIPKENINLRIDFGYGFGVSSGTGIYLGLGEAF
ncbi:BamA/TamA family outer membrane protein [Lewinella sp. 4G2]|uniref:BamA/TamA family outer membrane protein n=1 Tax=Lewinella sp. 4G2 TaxID=1803372 RepID=UPI0007B4D249|nr:BamA/TamA family outer membrane protein [Lewinella sp. 4G2]OAV44170.1 hypothetical protein A3850_006520 [Lewinella sp. 4G2]